MGVRFDDDVEPWRAGGNNRNAGKPIVRYGPRPNAEREYHQRQAEGMYYDRLCFRKELIEKFNAANDSEQREEYLKKLTQRCNLHFAKFGMLHSFTTDVDRFLLDCYYSIPMEFVFSVSYGQLIFKKLFNAEKKEYITQEVIPLRRLTLELRGHNKKDWKKSKLEIHVLITDDDRPSWHKCFFGF